MTLTSLRYKIQAIKKKWYSLGDYLEKLQENPQFLEQVASGVTAPNLVQKSQQQIKEDIEKQKHKNCTNKIE